MSEIIITKEAMEDYKKQIIDMVSIDIGNENKIEEDPTPYEAYIDEIKLYQEIMDGLSNKKRKRRRCCFNCECRK